jgi:hypothetical protein
MVAWLLGARWCRMPLGQPKDLYYPCGSTPVAGRPELSRRVVPNNGAHVLEALVQPPKNVEDEDPIFDEGT